MPLFNQPIATQEHSPYNTSMRKTAPSFNIPRQYIGLGLIALTALVLSRFVYAPSDDAYIFLVYAKNFLNGNGLTFNGTLVEGFSSPLWMILLLLFGAAKIPLPLLMQILSTLSGFFALFTTYLLGQKIFKDKLWALLPPLLLAGSGDFIFYLGVGLEQVLFTALLALSIAEMWDDSAAALQGNKLPVYLALLILTRPEGGLFGILILLWGWLKTRSFRLPVITGLKLSGVVAPVLIFRKLYYGFWLPNTYYVKANAGLENINLGKIYLIRNGIRYWPVVILLVVVVILLLLKKRSNVIVATFPLLGMTAAWAVYIWLVGGDNLVGGRLLIPVLPLAYIATILMMKENSLQFRPAAMVVLLAGILTFIGYTQNDLVQSHSERWRRNLPVRQNAGLYLKEHFPSDTLVALNPAGIIPFYSELPTIDMLGLNDEYIAHAGKRDFSLDFGHQAGDGAYVLTQKPDVILFGGGVSAKPGALISDREIAEHPEFSSLYQPVIWPGIGTAYIRTTSE